MTAIADRADSSAPAATPPTPVVVIDPGHGGSARVGGSSSNNASGPNGLLEKDLTLDLGRRVGAALGGRAQVVLTRSGDVNQSLGERARVARDANASVFLSIHLNGFRDPAVDGSEAWVARHASEQSRRLARSVLDGVLSVTHAHDRGVREDDLGVLLPDRHAPATAATLLEVAFLTNPDEAHRLESEAYRQSIAQAIADGVAKQLGANGVPATATALTTTDQQTALDLVSTFRAESTAGAFTPARSDVADRAAALITDPTLVDQGSLNVCGPAAVLRLWIARDPVAFTRYLTTLYDSGSASFGTRVVSPGRDLRHQDYDGRAVPAMRAAGGVCPSADWIALSSLRDASNTFLDFEGMPSEDVSAMSTPADVAGWLRSTALYSSVTDEGNWLLTRDVAHAEGLRPGPTTDVVLLINAHILTASAASGRRKSDEFILSAFPNHFVVLESAVTEPTPDEVEFDCWTWGGRVHVRLRKDVFQPNYYGAVIGQVTVTGTTPASGLEARALAAPPTPVVVTADSALVRADRVIPATACGVLRNPDGTYRERVPEKIVIHVLDGGTYDDDIAHWHAGASCVPPHYVIKRDGEITQLVAEKYMAQHAGPGGNPTMVGIEHDGTDSESSNFTEELYLASSALVRDICNRNGIPVDREHIIGHDEVPGTDHGDPAGYWDWDYYMALVRWNGADTTQKPVRVVIDATTLSGPPLGAAWHKVDRDEADSRGADGRTARERMGPLFFSGYGPWYVRAEAATDAPATDAAEFTFVVPQAGSWQLSGWWPLLADGNTATQFEISTTSSDPNQQLQTLVVDQRARWRRTRPSLALQETPTWCPLPVFDLQQNDIVKVRVLRRSDAPGKVIADAVRFLKT